MITLIFLAIIVGCIVVGISVGLTLVRQEEQIYNAILANTTSVERELQLQKLARLKELRSQGQGYQEASMITQYFRGLYNV
jgi:hypothetical protein